MSDTSGSGGVGFFGHLCIAFVVLKLCGVISWSWWWITAPAWIPAGLALMALGAWLIYASRK